VASAAGDTRVSAFAGPPGIPRYINVGLTDMLKPDARAKPFYSRVGVCYTNKDGSHPAATFEIERGYRSWGGNGTNYNDPRLRKYFNKYVNLYQQQTCHNLDHQQNQLRTKGEDNTDKLHGCPADGVTPLESAATCKEQGGVPAKSKEEIAADDICLFETRAVKAVDSLDQLTDADGVPVDFYRYYYDATTGMLLFYVMQDSENAQGTSPLGSCRGQADDDPACPNPNHPTFPESYYGCPAQGCVTYTIRMTDGAAYDPGASACGDPSDESRKSDPAAIYRVARNADGVGKFEQPGGKDPYHLAYLPSPQSPDADVRAGLIVKTAPNPGSKGFPHVEARFPPYCAGTPAAVSGDHPQAGHAYDR